MTPPSACVSTPITTETLHHPPHPPPQFKPHPHPNAPPLYPPPTLQFHNQLPLPHPPPVPRRDSVCARIVTSPLRHLWQRRRGAGHGCRAAEVAAAARRRPWVTWAAGARMVLVSLLHGKSGGVGWVGAGRSGADANRVGKVQKQTRTCPLPHSAVCLLAGTIIKMAQPVSRTPPAPPPSLILLPYSS
jgi:hypothetical protein